MNKVIMIFIAILYILLVANSAFSQEENYSMETTKTVEPEIVYDGGLKGFYKYITNNLKYPEEAKKQGVEGKVYVGFSVDENGLVQPESIKIVKGTQPLLNEEAIRLIENSPKWDPAKLPKKRKKKDLKMILPISFSL